MIKVLFVCLGNICRSPMAEAVFRDLTTKEGISHRFEIASAGTGSWEVGERPHRGTVQVLRENQIEIGNKRAQQVKRSDIDAYDYIIAMDSENVIDIQAMYGKRVRRLMEFAPKGFPTDIPDPYYTGGFDHVFQLVRAGCTGLLAYIREKEGL